MKLQLTTNNSEVNLNDYVLIESILSDSKTVKDNNSMNVLNKTLNVCYVKEISNNTIICNTVDTYRTFIIEPTNENKLIGKIEMEPIDNYYINELGEVSKYDEMINEIIYLLHINRIKRYKVLKNTINNIDELFGL